MSRQPKQVARASSKTLAVKIVQNYRETDGCPPLRQHWGGHSLSETQFLGTFASKVADDSHATEAWNSIENHCDTSRIIELLYLFTVPKDVYVEENREDHRALRAELEKISSIYATLLSELSEVGNSEQSRRAMLYKSLSEEIELVTRAKVHMDQLIEESKLWGSGKIKLRDWYLHLLAGELESSIGKRHSSVLWDLINAAREAQGLKTKMLDEESLNRSIQRCRMRLRHWLRLKELAKVNHLNAVEWLPEPPADLFESSDSGQQLDDF
jgi:hypothetical protein